MSTGVYLQDQPITGGPYNGPPVTPASTRYWLSTDLPTFSTVWMSLWITRPHPTASGYFHCVETTNPPAMKPKPTTMFQLPSVSIGSLVADT